MFPATKNKTRTVEDFFSQINFDDLPRVVAVVGSRDFSQLESVGLLVCAFTAGTIVVSGGAKGVDAAARRAATTTRTIHYKEFAVESFEWDHLGKGAGHIRNSTLIHYVSQVKGMAFIFINSDALFAQRGGSYNAIKTCEKMGVRHQIITEVVYV